MKKTVAPTLIAMAIAAAGISTTAQANDWYLGAGAGYADTSDIERNDTGLSGDGEAVSLFTGYNFSDYFGTELGFTRFGQDVDTNALTLSAIGRMPLSERMSLFGELGALGYDIKANGGDKGLSPMAGLGLTYRASDLVDVQARYRRVEDMGEFNKVGFETDINNYMLEVVLHPNRGESTPPPVAPVAQQPEAETTYETRSVTADGSIYFAFDKSDLSGESRATLDEVARFAEENPDYQVELAGYADRLGTAEYNRKLSERRAMAAKEYLVDRGVAAQNIQTAWYGSELAEGQTEAERQRDRRVDAKAQATIEVEIVE
ncbi:OmpA family protein [Oceanisphaera avium]|uniref:Cell envelope biogenesis protein OmpA n=1 Tax=Oceanisphaera avium TaxID=1903694 RepID=A0A1Y0CW65_9GAMM|nr:OmpA family protein [Oceanisphaera avium]ART79571.1 cell envelope biogenesis protein OmpA [Oceanisphaera avium]